MFSMLMPGLKRIATGNTDASVKSTLPPRFRSVAVVFEAFFGFLAVASILLFPLSNHRKGKRVEYRYKTFHIHWSYQYVDML
jgi:hypothetical protein